MTTKHIEATEALAADETAHPSVRAGAERAVRVLRAGHSAAQAELEELEELDSRCPHGIGVQDNETLHILRAWAREVKQ